jgi:hypothetical protein
METKFEVAKVNDVFADFYKQLEEAKQINEQTVFDYESKKGNKEARSHIYKLRQSKSAISKAHKEAKAEALEFGRTLDAEKKKLVSEIEEMIEVHEAPIKEIEEREKTRIASIQYKIDWFKQFKEAQFNSSVEASETLETIKKCIIDDLYDEFQESAKVARFEAIEIVENKFTELVKIEEEQAELERQRKEKEEAERKAREEEIARKAKEEAELKAKQEAERKELEAKQAIERAEKEKNEAIEKAQQRAELEKQQAIQAEKDRVAREQAAKDAKEKAEREAEQRRQANRAHQGKINREILKELKLIGLDEDVAKEIIKRAAKGLIPNLKIVY